MEEMREPVLVTGATGCIGHRLVDRLVEEGLEVRALVLPTDRLAAELPAEVELVWGDIANPAPVRAAAEGVGTVFHLAAVVTDWGAERLFEDVAIAGTAALFRALRGSGAHVLLASSIVVYGDALGRDVCDEERPFGKTYGMYGRAKQAQETMARRLADELDLPLTVVRPANVYGPRSGPWVRQIVKVLRAGLPSLVGTGEQNAGLTYVDNVVDVLVRAARTRDAVGRTFNAADDSSVGWRRYVEDLARIVDAPPPKSIPLPAAKIAAPTLETFYRVVPGRGRPAITREALQLVQGELQIPIERARAGLGYEPLVSYEEGLDATARYIRDAGL